MRMHYVLTLSHICKSIFLTILNKCFNHKKKLPVEKVEEEIPLCSLLLENFARQICVTVSAAPGRRGCPQKFFSIKKKQL